MIFMDSSLDLLTLGKNLLFQTCPKASIINYTIAVADAARKEGEKKAEMLFQAYLGVSALLLAVLVCGVSFT